MVSSLNEWNFTPFTDIDNDNDNSSLKISEWNLTMCRDHSGRYLPTIDDIFLLHACETCFSHVCGVSNTSLDHWNSSAIADACNEFGAKTDGFVGSCGPVESCTTRVTKCCEAANECCNQQISQESSTAQDGYCPQTWDGYNCINFTQPGVQIQLPCPDFVPNFVTLYNGFKNCQPNGTWEGQEMIWEPSHYSPHCVYAHHLQQFILALVKLTLRILSLVLLLTSLLILFAYRSLHHQPRIRLHIHLFVSLACTDICEILPSLFELKVYQALSNTRGKSINSALEDRAIWCCANSMGMRFFLNASFVWMFCEAVFLYRLLSNTFNQDKGSIIPYVLFGWGVPTLMSAIYIPLRAFSSYNSLCWVEDPPTLEWLLRGTNLIFILANVILLIAILTILKKLPTHANEMGSFRRWLRATILLMPLFGLQWCFVILRAPEESSYYFPYSLIQTIVISSHGGIVALAFCILNQEVRSTLQRSFLRYRRLRGSAAARDTFFLNSSRNSSKQYKTPSTVSVPNLEANRLSQETQIPLLMKYNGNMNNNNNHDNHDNNDNHIEENKN